MYREVVELLERITTSDPVPCGTCTACCRGRTEVHILTDHGDRIEDYDRLQVHLPTGRMMLSFKDNGDCAYLEDGKCSIYDKRPAVCRAFDCRRERYAFNEKSRREMAIQYKVFSREIFEAGAERLPTMNLTQEEIVTRMWDGHADFMLAGLAGR